jgi:D-glycero-alpha-D-manno-heptose-7-phosphate kinase
MNREILKIIHAQAPLRINDIGGWTDTWFAKEGNVLNVAVGPPVEVQIKIFKNDENKKKRVMVNTENFGETFWMDPEKPSSVLHPLLQHTISSLPMPQDRGLEISLFSPVPAGISTGTSASVCVALLGALNFLAGQTHSAGELASLAHKVETEKLKQQSGIQDQICAAYGGVCFIQVDRYPQARVQRLELSEKIWKELERRLCLIYLGQPHNSSAIHKEVIALVKKGSPQRKHLEKLKDLAGKAKDFLLKGDLEAYGEVMVKNNECQRGLCAQLISEKADGVIQVARKYKASGWKVNGAGGRGGSMTLLGHADDVLRREMIREINSKGDGIRSLPLWLSTTGVSAWAI